MMSEERQELVKKLIQKDYLKSEKVKNAFFEISRENFVSKKDKNKAYIDTPIQIGSGQTISAPHMIAIMCEELDLKPGQKVLEIGTGSGYHAAVVSKIIGKSGHVYSIERHENLAEKAKINIQKACIKNVSVEVGDGSRGLSKYQPYDRIYVTCAAPEIPKPLVDQLKDPGKLLIPVGRMFCELIRLEKKMGKTYTYNLCDCAFVPLIGKYGH